MAQRRFSLSVLVVVLAVLAGAAFFVIRAYDKTEEESEGIEGANADELTDPARRRAAREEARRGEGEWQHHDWTGRESETAEAHPNEASEEDERSSASRSVHGRDFDPESRDGDEGEGEREDPQLASMQRSFRMSNGADAGMSLPFDPIEQEARIVAHEGTLTASNGDTCQVRVLPVRTRAFNCLVRVMCAGQVLYPNPDQTAGYAPCDVVDGRVVSALDEGHTAADGDPLIRFDAAQGIVTVEDRGDGVAPFRATLRLSRQL